MFAASVAGAADLSEQDYFEELPQVLTVTRLAQPLRDTPGAVTIIDRETIRRSGARELVDVLRLVPGYMVGGWNGANPGAAYHAPLDDYGTRNLVLVDGRSVYSSFYLGDTHRGLMSILLEDIERIEVLRGSNSAAYGANALFGVINIVTRHTADTRGVELSMSSGEGSIKDNYARLGWGSDNASFRLSAGRRQDSGYRNAHDDKTVAQVHFRGDLKPSNNEDVLLAAGYSEMPAGEGFQGENGNIPRTVVWYGLYLSGQWSWRPALDEEIKLSANYNEEQGEDSFIYPLDKAVTVDFGGRGRRLNLEAQHQFAFSTTQRVVWGAGYKYEDARSAPLYYTSDVISISELRLFGNYEWRPHPRWLFNFGGFWANHSRSGSYFMPRLMANFHVTPDHTLRIGASESQRTPSIYELAADRRYRLSNGTDLRYDVSTGNVRPEKLLSHEAGYFGNFHDWRLTLDVRAYHESMKGVIANREYDLPGYTVRKVNDYVNFRDMETHGIEYQLRWKPFADTEIWLNHNTQGYRWLDGQNIRMPPVRSGTLALFQKLPLDFDFSLIFHTSTPMTWRHQQTKLPELRRVDARLAKSFRMGATRAEAAISVHAVGGDYVASYPLISQPAMIQERSAFGTLRLEF